MKILQAVLLFLVISVAGFSQTGTVKGFVTDKEDRSKMNATFNLTDDHLKEQFDSLWNDAGINGLKGHRSVGGYRASMYNALPLESVQVLVDVMKELERVS